MNTQAQVTEALDRWFDNHVMGEKELCMLLEMATEMQKTVTDPTGKLHLAVQIEYYSRKLAEWEAAIRELTPTSLW